MTSLRYLMIAKSTLKVCDPFSWFTFGVWQEEKLEPLRNITDDPRIRLLNRLYARKRKELKERKKLKAFPCILNVNILMTIFLLSSVLQISLNSFTCCRMLRLRRNQRTSARLMIYFHLLMARMEVCHVFHPDHFSEFHLSLICVLESRLFSYLSFFIGGWKMAFLSYNWTTFWSFYKIILPCDFVSSALILKFCFCMLCLDIIKYKL